MEDRSYGALIKNGRLARKWTQETLARRMHTSAGTVSRWENNHTRPNLDQMDQLSRLLGIPIDSLIESGGVNLSPLPEVQLYQPLVEVLAEMSLAEQRALYDFFETARRGAAPAPRRPGRRSPG